MAKVNIISGERSLESLALGRWFLFNGKLHVKLGMNAEFGGIDVWDVQDNRFIGLKPETSVIALNDANIKITVE